MKAIRKNLASFIIAVLFMTTLLPNVVFANEDIQDVSIQCNIMKNAVQIQGVAFTESNTINPHADIIEWRYKSENGKLYRRLYNYSKMKWIGEWELCE
jgi:hypothetical protein